MLCYVCNSLLPTPLHTHRNGFFDLIYRIVTPETQDMVFSWLQIVNSLAKKIKALGIDLDTQDEIEKHGIG